MTLRLVVLAFCVVGSLAGRSTLRIDPNLSWRVVGGSNAPDGAYPYQVSLQKNGVHDCGGTIVHENYVITAAHCVVSASTSSLKVKVGINKLTDPGTQYQVKLIHSHQDYDPWKIINDVAILKVDTINLSASKVGKIFVDTENIGEDVPVVLSGWGSTRVGSGTPNDLQQINLKTITVEFCNSRHPREVLATQICTFTKSGEGACQGDSGGPLVRTVNGQTRLVGIVSWGKPCAVGYPDVFARASSYADWFNSRCNKCLNK